MVFWCIFTEILQRGKSLVKFLYFIQNDKRFARDYRLFANGSDNH